MGLDWKKYKSEFMKFEDIGDSVAGTIIALQEGKDFNGKSVPELVIDTDAGARKVTAGQVMLQAALAEKEPEEGDYIVITYSGNGEGKPGRAPAKLFEVKVTKKGAEGAEEVSAEDLIPF